MLAHLWALASEQAGAAVSDPLSACLTAAVALVSLAVAWPHPAGRAR
jgi:hypothetical protein